MALANKLLLSQITGHIILLILSFCIWIPLRINLHEFCDHCLLFTTGKWREEDGMFDVNWASDGFCNFSFLTGIALSCISILQIIRFWVMKYADAEPSFLSLFIDVVLGIFMLAISILSAIFITLGFIVWCDGMTERFPSCETSAGQNVIRGDTEKIDTSNFYMEMGTAQFGAWVSFATSVGLAVIALLKLINNHQVRNIKVSMYLERQRLVNQGQSDGRSTPPLASGASSDSDNNK
ncbi:transmembrane protein 179 [Scaptodrosophila lebanonensis]|uniref:Transmembrane protein 179 n=1 Tax=Drosophila lebanonensis TaxID=7225 RepID=A0A6J2T6J2_DROLE|nr:transmembrane protein 179 [Scaptodrosophila lebanonensis]